MFDLVRIVYVDLEIKEKQIAMLERIGVGLGFVPSNVEFIVQKALKGHQ